MKNRTIFKRCLIIMYCISMSQVLFARGLYDHFFAEGKKWVYREIVKRRDEPKVEYSSAIEIKGDTLIDGVPFFKAFFTSQYKDTTYLYAFYREEDRRVFYRLPNGTETIKSFDFNMSEGDVDIIHWERMGRDDIIVKYMDVVESENHAFLRWHLIGKDAFPDGATTALVYGVGYEGAGLFDMAIGDGVVITSSSDERITYNFDSCYENGECICRS